MSINTKPNVPQCGPNKKHGKLQLWTNQPKTRYAIRFENEVPFLASSDSKVDQYTTLIAESDTVLKGYEYDWKFIINKWIVSHKVATGFKTRSGLPFVHFESIPKNKRTSSAKNESKSYFYVTTLDGKSYSVRLKLHIKCHFCKLLFDTNNKRNEHERAWRIIK